MSRTTAQSGREAQLSKKFPQFIRGDLKITSRLVAQHYLEAVCVQSPPSTCIERIVSSSDGIAAVRNAVRCDLSLPFIHKTVVPFLHYLSDPSIKALFDGSFLRQILDAVVEPPTFWKALVGFFKSKKLEPDGVEALAWLSLELISTVPPLSDEILDDVRNAVNDGTLLESSKTQTRTYGYRIQKILRLTTENGHDCEEFGPGGRHDNDFADFRLVSVYPTRHELASSEMPYYQTAAVVADVNIEHRPRAHLENQYRLLREDMVWVFREDIQVATGRQKKGKRSPLVLGSLVLCGISMSSQANPQGRTSILLKCGSGLEQFQKLPLKHKKELLESQKGPIKHQAFGAFIVDKEAVAFGFVVKDNDGLVQKPPVLHVQLTEVSSLKTILAAIASREAMEFAPVDTPVFAYEPVLERLKEITELPLDDYLINPKAAANSDFRPCSRTQLTIEKLKRLGGQGCTMNGLPLDANQVEAFIHALERPVAVIQGPPGTGKSYIGAHFVREVVGHGKRVLVLSYTNHALDQFLEDLLKIGISAKDMVRLGSKSTQATAQLSLREQKSTYKRSTHAWTVIRSIKSEIIDLQNKLEDAGNALKRPGTSPMDILDYLEFHDTDFFKALSVPDDGSDDGFDRVGKGGRKMAPGYLVMRWLQGKGPGPFKERFDGDSGKVWRLSTAERAAKSGQWGHSIRDAKISEILDLGNDFRRLQSRLETLLKDEKRSVLREKKLIGCTTTAAAMQQALIKEASPDIVVVEEAGEILEAHVLAALSPSVAQLVLIGDHKQLRPKNNNYNLSVEKGDGYDLNKSLFERLILDGHDFKVLTRQHRMHPDISRLPRALTYPHLQDGDRTATRPFPKGIQGRVIFVNHESPEDELAAVEDRRDMGSKSSKQNKFEALMVLRMVKYLGQQGYKTENIVVLTPYLGQLRMLQETLSQENDPFLNDLDSFDMRRAGLLTDAAAKVGKKPLRISTVDNYQGEESDIVIVSLTRSNPRGDIGFLYAPERLNVLLTRARNAVVLIGNMETFMNSRKGKDLWTKFFGLLKEGDSLHDGFPVRCEQHPSTTALLKEPQDFDRHCPDGGCSEPCGTLLSCGQHQCSLRCHQLKDHTNFKCAQSLTKVCDRNHRTKVVCNEKDRACPKCQKEDADMRRRIKRDLALEQERKVQQTRYEHELQQIQDEIDHERRVMKHSMDDEEDKKTLAQKRADLDALKQTRQRLDEQMEASRKAKDQSAKASSSSKPKKTVETPTESWQEPQNAEEEWACLKKFEGATSPPLDGLMGMIGLETVKQKFLSTKSRVDTAVRQQVSLSKERFSCSLLGNPGTGKTTVARMYAQFLTSVGVIPGSKFEETTGSKLANMGVQGCQGLLDGILDDGGGVLFIDEAYQLSSGNSPGGKAVLDFLLAEVENLTGKVVFVLAGYTRQMETFFAHNPGLPSRFPIEMKFDDYSDDELLRILRLKIEQKYSHRMKAEGGLDGLYCRIVARRIGRGRGREGFGNAREVENVLTRILNRQSDSLRRARRSGKPLDDMLLTITDLIGPEPGQALNGCDAWKKLNCLIGLRSVKESVKALVDTMQANYQRELAEEPLVEYSLNKVFLGSPGTGKTTVANLYGQVLVDLGLLSNGEVVEKNPADFVGGALGQSEQQTKGILAATMGKVLVIDEAYGLYGGSGSSGGAISDPYKTAVVDTIVAQVQSTPGEDRCVLLLGYKDQMEDMFQNVNPGLSRRFPLASAFVFEDFSDAEMSSILDLKLKHSGFNATSQAKRVALEVVGRARNRPNFGNAGEVDILLNAAKARHQARLSKGLAKAHSLFEAVDFDEDFDRAERADTNLQKLFHDTVGCDKLVGLLEGYQNQVRTLKGLGLEPKENIPFNFLFRGPPGTGKTSTARKMGKVYYDMGFLATADVVECSATDLIGQYVGQTGPKVQQLLDKALGRVLFVDEAYRLGEGHFAKEAVDELVDCVTKTKYLGKMVIILAGYDDDINRLLSVNPGMSSRFPEVVDFYPLGPEDSWALLVKRLTQQKAKVEKSGSTTLDISSLASPSSAFKTDVLGAFGSLMALEGWANARDVETLAKAVFGRAIKNVNANQGALVIDQGMVDQELVTMLTERTKREEARSSRSRRSGPAFDHLMQTLDLPTRPPNKVTQQTTTTAEEEHRRPPDPQSARSRKPETARRDVGVSDEVWEQLQRDKQAEEAREQHYKDLLAKSKAKSIAEADRQRIVDELLEEEARRQKEAEMQKKLANLGCCPVGYAWIKQDSGYRCAGGSHFLSSDVLGDVLEK